MYQPTEYQKSIFRLDQFGEPELTRAFPSLTPRRAMQYTMARFAFVIDQMELGKIVNDDAYSIICGGCAYTFNFTDSAECCDCPVEKACNSQTFADYIAGGGQQIALAKRVLQMLQGHYEKKFGKIRKVI